MTSYSYQFAGEMSARDEPFRHVEELPGPSGEQSFVSTNKDYSKHNYGRPHISYIPDTGKMRSQCDVFCFGEVPQKQQTNLNTDAEEMKPQPMKLSQY